jgi:hypothetical protein
VPGQQAPRLNATAEHLPQSWITASLELQVVVSSRTYLVVFACLPGGAIGKLEWELLQLLVMIYGAMPHLYGNDDQ